jgi:hypothetical protein
MRDKKYIFSGQPRQHGSGFGSLALGVARYALPFLSRYVLPTVKSLAKDFLGDSLIQGAAGMSDVLGGRETAKSAVRKRGLSVMRNVVAKKMRGGGGARKPRRKKKPAAKPGQRRRRRRVNTGVKKPIKRKTSTRRVSNKKAKLAIGRQRSDFFANLR